MPIDTRWLTITWSIWLRKAAGPWVVCANRGSVNAPGLLESPREAKEGRCALGRSANSDKSNSIAIQPTQNSGQKITNEKKPVYHFHLFGVVGITVTGLNQRPSLVEDGGYHQTQWEQIARRRHRWLDLHLRRCSNQVIQVNVNNT